MTSCLALFNCIIDAFVTTCARLPWPRRVERQWIEQLFGNIPRSHGNAIGCEQHANTWPQQIRQGSVEASPSIISQVSPWKTMNSGIAYRSALPTESSATTDDVVIPGLRSRKVSQDQIHRIKQLCDGYRDPQSAFRTQPDPGGHQTFARSAYRDSVHYVPVDNYFAYPAEWLGEAGSAPHVHLPLKISVADRLQDEQEAIERAGKQHAEEQKKRLHHWGSVEGAAVLVRDCVHCMAWLFYGDLAIRDAKFRQQDVPSSCHMLTTTTTATTAMSGTSTVLQREMAIQNPFTRTVSVPHHNGDEDLPAPDLTTPSNDVTSMRRYEAAPQEIWNKVAVSTTPSFMRQWSTCTTVESLTPPTCLVQGSDENADVVPSRPRPMRPRPILGSEGGRYEKVNNWKRLYYPGKKARKIVHRRRRQEARCKVERDALERYAKATGEW